MSYKRVCTHMIKTMTRRSNKSEKAIKVLCNEYENPIEYFNYL